MTSLALSRIAEMTGGRLTGADPGRMVSRISADSRDSGPGTLFFALIGEKTDGHVFARRAVAAGAAGVVRADWFEASGRPEGAFLLTEDPLAALGRLGAAWRSQFEIPVVGITGSMGKTTTREMLASALRSRMNVLVSPANFNTEIGVPITLLDLTPSHDIAVIEMAMRGKGQIADLCRMARPSGAVVTNVGLTHIELLGSRDAIASAKAELLKSLPDGGWAVLNADDAYFDYLSGIAPGPAVTFGLSEGAQFRGSDVRLNSAGCASFLLEAPGAAHRVQLRAPGAFHASNALAAAAAASRFGVTLEETVAALEAYEGFEKRSRVTQAAGGWLVFDDTYNASPAATEGALDSLAAMTAAGRRIAVLGDMRELGEQSSELHRQIGHKVAEVRPDLLVTVGESSAAIDESALAAGYGGPVEHFAASKEAAEFAAALVRPGDVVLVKGSRALEMERIVERLLE
jgi:UDP-N-acetylmuramoyl-tripeptide--D-alanyl-D-alanine ligase